MDNDERPNRFKAPEPSPEPETPEGPPASPQESPPDHERRSLLGRVEVLRRRAAGSGRPLGSPEGRGTPPRPAPASSTTGFTDPRRVVDTTALIVRTLSGFLDGFFGERLGADLVMTAEETYAIAAPLAGYVLDHRPESGPMAAAVERAGLVGAGAGAVGYGARALFFRRPGGRAESERIEENLVRRLSREAKRQGARVEPGEEQGDGSSPFSPPGSEPTLNSLYGDDEGTGYVG